MLYLCDVVGTGKGLVEDGVDDPFRPAIGSRTVIPGWLDLRPDPTVATGYGLVELPVRVTRDSRLRLFADDPAEPLSATAESLLGSRLSLTFTRRATVKDAITELLTDHARTDGTRWRPLTIGHDGCRRVFIGGREIDVLAGPAPSHSQSHSESWPTNGTTLSSGQDNVWAQRDAGNLAEVSSGVLRASTTATAQHGATSGSGLLDSANHYISAAMTIASKSGTLQRTSVECRFTNGTNLYRAHWRRETANERGLLKRVTGTQTALGSDSTDPGAAFTGECRADGSTISMSLGGTVIFSVTDTSLTTPSVIACFGINTAVVGDATIGATTFADLGGGLLLGGRLVGRGKTAGRLVLV